MFTLRQLRYFVAVAEHENITMAAAALNVSQPAISAVISELERRFGVQLFIRYKAKGVKLTPDAQKFLSAARSLLAHADELDSQSKALTNSLTGTLTIGCFDTIAPFYLPHILSEFSKRCPSVNIDLSEGPIDVIEAQLLSGQREIALLYDIDLTDNIEVEKLAEVPPYVLLPATHALAKRRSISLAELASDPLVLLDLPHSTGYFLSLFSQLKLKPRVRFRTGNFEMVRGLVANGHGYAILNSRPAHNFAYDGSSLVGVEIRDDIKALDLVVARLKNVRLTHRANTFVDYCRQHFSRWKLPALGKRQSRRTT